HANRMKGITGENLLSLCESRLDNVVYRMGIAPTRRAARQLVSHAHINVNGEVCNIPSRSLRPGDVVSVREKSKTLSVVTNNVASASAKLDWVTFDAATLSGSFVARPVREQIPENIKEQLIVELYSK
ncbi:MAG: 30S ribosomal protein S4, partial [Flavobacteriales bacterium]